MKNYVKEYSKSKAIVKRLRKMGAQDNFIQSDRELKIIKTTGVDVEYEITNDSGQRERRRFYLYKKNKNTIDMGDILAELELDMRFNLMPKKGLQMAERGTLKRAKLDKFDYTSLHPDIAQAQFEANNKTFKKWKEASQKAFEEGVSVEMLENSSDDIEKTKTDLWGNVDSEMRNEYYHTFGATDTDDATIASYLLWKKRV